MADEDGCKPELFSVMSNHAQDKVLPDRVLTGRRLVKKQYGWIRYEGPG